MKLLTKSQVGKLNKTSAKVEFMQDKLTVEPLSGGKGRLDFPVPFSPTKKVTLEEKDNRFSLAKNRMTGSLLR